MIIDVNQSNIQEELVTKSAEKTILFYVYDPVRCAPSIPEAKAALLPPRATAATITDNNAFFIFTVLLALNHSYFYRLSIWHVLEHVRIL